MIGRIAGRLLVKQPPQIIVDVNGVGYEIDVPMSTLYQLPATGEPVTLFTHLAIREDAHQLFGFATEAERALFRQLIRISGIGARTALSVLSGMSVAELHEAVRAKDGGRLTKIPGIGKKTAERLLLELRDRLPKGVVQAGTAAASTEGSDIANALSALGYNDKEVTWVVGQLPAGLEDRIGGRFFTHFPGHSPEIRHDKLEPVCQGTQYHPKGQGEGRWPHAELEYTQNGLPILKIFGIHPHFPRSVARLID